MAAIGSVAPLFEELTAACADEVLVVATETEIGSLRHGAFDAALLFPNSFRSAWVARRARIPEIWGYAGSFRSLDVDASDRSTVRPGSSVCVLRGFGPRPWLRRHRLTSAHHRPSGNHGPCRRHARGRTA